MTSHDDKQRALIEYVAALRAQGDRSPGLGSSPFSAEAWKMIEDALKAFTPSHARRLPCGTPESEMPNSSPCCGEYDKCVRACTPRGEWIASQRRPTHVAPTADNVGATDRWQDPRDLSGGETDCAPSTTPQKPGKPTEAEIDAAITKACGKYRTLDSYTYEDVHAVVEAVCTASATPCSGWERLPEDCMLSLGPILEWTDDERLMISMRRCVTGKPEDEEWFRITLPKLPPMRATDGGDKTNG